MKTPTNNKEDFPRWDTNEEWKKNYAPYIRWGIFYSNKNDKRLWVPKYKSKYGTTLNIAHPKAIFILIGLVLVVLAIMFAMIGVPLIFH